MIVVGCKCGARRTIAGDIVGRPFLSFLFALFDYAEMTAKGWTYSAGRWWCLHCTRRRNLLHSVKGDAASNVTAPPPPTGDKK
jgi:hypothetical protein